MERTEIVRIVTAIFNDDTGEEEVDHFVQLLVDELGKEAVWQVLFHGPTTSPEEIAEQLLGFPKARILLTPPPDSA